MAALFNLKHLPLLRRFIETPQVLPLRKFLFDIHLWCGVAMGLYLIMQSVTGVSLVFRDELDEAFNNPSPLKVASSRLGFGTLVERVEQENPGNKVTGIINNLKPEQPVRMYAINAGSHRTAVIIDQYSGKILGPIPENAVLNFLQELHFNMLLERTGRKINGFNGFLLCGMCTSGIFIWWKGIRIWTRGLVVAWQSGIRRLNWDAHHAVGFWMLPLLFNWGLSAIYFGYRTEFEAVVNQFLPVTSLQRPTDRSSASLITHGSQSSSSNSGVVTLDEMVKVATAAAPGLNVARIAIPGVGKERHSHKLEIWLTKANSIRKDLATEVDIDVRTGTILSISTPDQRPSGDVFMAWLTRLHFGNFGGVPLKILWCIIGLAPAVLSITGLYLWWHRITRKKSYRPSSIKSLIGIK